MTFPDGGGNQGDNNYEALDHPSLKTEQLNFRCSLSFYTCSIAPSGRSAIGIVRIASYRLLMISCCIFAHTKLISFIPVSLLVIAVGAFCYWPKEVCYKP
jgi:hypothetical protein